MVNVPKNIFYEIEIKLQDDNVQFSVILAIVGSSQNECISYPRLLKVINLGLWTVNLKR